MKRIALPFLLALLFLPVANSAGALAPPTISSVTFSPSIPSPGHVVDVTVHVEWNHGNVSGVSFTTCSGAMCGIPTVMVDEGDGFYTASAGPFELGAVEFTFMVSHDLGDDVIYIQNLTIGEANGELAEESGGYENLFVLVIASSAIVAGAALFFLSKRAA